MLNMNVVAPAQGYGKPASIEPSPEIRTRIDALRDAVETLSKAVVTTAAKYAGAARDPIPTPTAGSGSMASLPESIPSSEIGRHLRAIEEIAQDARRTLMDLNNRCAL